MATVDDPVEEKPMKTAMRPTLRRRVGYPKKINETKCDSGGPIATRRWPEEPRRSMRLGGYGERDPTGQRLG